MTSSSLQNMAPNVQRALFIALVFGAIAVVVYMFCVQPAQLSLTRQRQDLDSLQARQDIAHREIRGEKALRERLDGIRTTRQRYLDALLTPLLESYAMRAKSIIDPIAADSGVTVQDYQERPRRLLPLTKPQAPQLYARQPIHLACRGSYAAIISFMMRIEKLLPLVSVEAFSLKVQTDNDVQTAELVLEWPILGVNTKDAAAKGGVKK